MDHVIIKEFEKKINFQLFTNFCREVMETNIPEPVLNEIEDLSEESCPTPKKVFLPIKGQEFGDGHIKVILTEYNHLVMLSSDHDHVF